MRLRRETFSLNSYISLNMKLIVLFVGLCACVGVLCSVHDQVKGASANSSCRGHKLASCNEQRLIRKRRILPLIPLFLGVVAVGATAVVVQMLIVDDTNNRHRPAPPKTSARESLENVNTLVHSLYKKFANKNELCDRKPNRHRRQPNPNNCPLPVFTTPGINYYNEIEDIAFGLRNNPNLMTVDVSNNNAHSITNYTTMTAPANQYHPEPIDLTLTMQAHLTHNSLTRPPRQDFPNAITLRMREMDWYHQGNLNTNDERGHLLGYASGGSDDPWNIVPQSVTLNRAVQIRGVSHEIYCWYDLEEEIRDFLRVHRTHNIFWTILVSYGGLPASRRPTGFMISVRITDRHHQFIGSGMYLFPNIPSDACTNPDHPFWRNPIL